MFNAFTALILACAIAASTQTAAFTCIQVIGQYINAKSFAQGSDKRIPSQAGPLLTLTLVQAFFWGLFYYLTH